MPPWQDAICPKKSLWKVFSVRPLSGECLEWDQQWQGLDKDSCAAMADLTHFPWSSRATVAHSVIPPGNDRVLPASHTLCLGSSRFAEPYNIGGEVH